MWLPGHYRRTDGGLSGPHSDSQSASTRTYAGSGAEVPTSPFYLQPAHPYGSSLGRPVGPRSHSLASTGHCTLHQEANQGGSWAYRPGYLRYCYGMLAGLHRHGQGHRSAPCPASTTYTYDGSAAEHHGMGSSARGGSRINAESQPHASSGYWPSLLYSTLGSGGYSVFSLPDHSLAYVSHLLVAYACLLSYWFS